MKVREEDNFRLITQLSDGWPEFKESLLDIYKVVIFLVSIVQTLFN